MAKRRPRGRVHGPYQERAGWRVVAVTHEGKRVAEVCASEAEALRLVVDLKAELGAKDATVTEAIDEYIAWKQVNGDRPLQVQSADTLRHRLNALFAGRFDTFVGDLSARDGEAMYEALREAQANDTHRNTLAAGKAFLGWCAERGYAGGNALGEVSGRGPRSVGKEQLTTDEAQLYADKAIELARAGDLGAVAAATVLYAGIRAGECAAIVARDVDNGGRALIIPKAKTKAGVRKMIIPQWLGRLLKASAGEGGRVFPGRDRYWVRYHVSRVCRLAGVPEITAHGMRGTHASLAVTGGASAEVVAATLGHTNIRITQRHYTKAEATDAARGRRAHGALKSRSARVPQTPSAGSKSKRKNRGKPND